MRLFLNMIPAKQRRMLYIAAAVLVLIAVIVGATGRASALKAVLIVGLGAIALIALLWVVIHFAMRGAKRKRQRAFDASVAAREGIDDRKREWQSWIQELERNKIDRYDLPFYLLVGEPQSGKSVLLQNSDLRFLFGQSRLSGVGGTRGCDWWFTEEAVILDLAGRLFTHDGGAADEAEWDAFLDLLNSFRPLDPANGIMLVIPCDSLLTDSVEASAQKANQIREALLTLTRKLEAKLPIYAILTKGDKIFGFAETVHRLDLEQRHQMFGWSRPADKLEHALEPHELREAWTDIVGRSTALRDSMLSTVRIPEAQAEVDRMLGFPEELEGLFAPLETYFERIFQDSDLVDQLYFRGVYLTSGLQSGAPIAKVCVDILDKPGDADGRDLETLFVRQQAYFIKDLVRRRVFGEKGLVKPTSARVAKARKTGRVGYGVAAGIAVLSVAWGIYEIRSDFNDSGRKSYAEAIAAGERWVPDESGGTVVANPSIEALLTSLSTIEAALDQSVSVAQALLGGRDGALQDVYDALYDVVYRHALQDKAANALAEASNGYDPVGLDARPDGFEAFKTQVLGALALRDGFSSADEAAALIDVIGLSDETAGAKDAHNRRLEGGTFAAEVGATKGLTARATKKLNALWDKTLDPSDKIRIRGDVGYLLGWYGLEAETTSMDKDFTGDKEADAGMYGVYERAHRIFQWMDDDQAGVGSIAINEVLAFRLPGNDLAKLRAELSASSTGESAPWKPYEKFRSWLADQKSLGLSKPSLSSVTEGVPVAQLMPLVTLLNNKDLIEVVDPKWLGRDLAATSKGLVANVEHASTLLASHKAPDLVTSVVRVKLALAANHMDRKTFHMALVKSEGATAEVGELARHVKTQLVLVALHKAATADGVSLEKLNTNTEAMLAEGIGIIAPLLSKEEQLNTAAISVLVDSHGEVKEQSAKKRAKTTIEEHLRDRRKHLLKTWEDSHKAWENREAAATTLPQDVLEHLDALASVFDSSDATLDQGRAAWLVEADTLLETYLAAYLNKLDKALIDRSALDGEDLAGARDRVASDLVGGSGHGKLAGWYSELADELRIPGSEDNALTRYAQMRAAANDDIALSIRTYKKKTRADRAGKGKATLERVRSRIADFKPTATLRTDRRGQWLAARFKGGRLSIPEISNADSDEISAYRTFSRHLNASFEDVIRRELRVAYLTKLEEIALGNKGAILSFWSDEADNGDAKVNHADSMRQLIGQSGRYLQLLDEYKQLDELGPTFRLDPSAASDAPKLAAGTDDGLAKRWWVLDAFLEDMLVYAHSGVESLADLETASLKLRALDPIAIEFRPSSESSKMHLETWGRFLAFRGQPFTGQDALQILPYNTPEGIFKTDPCKKWGLDRDYNLELVWWVQTQEGSDERPHKFKSCLKPFLLFWGGAEHPYRQGDNSSSATATVTVEVGEDQSGEVTSVEFEVTISPAPPRRPRFEDIPQELDR